MVLEPLATLHRPLRGLLRSYPHRAPTQSHRAATPPAYARGLHSSDRRAASDTSTSAPCLPVGSIAGLVTGEPCRARPAFRAPVPKADCRAIVPVAQLGPNNSFKPKTNRYAIVFGLTQALGGAAGRVRIVGIASASIPAIVRGWLGDFGRDWAASVGRKLPPLYGKMVRMSVAPLIPSVFGEMAQQQPGLR